MSEINSSTLSWKARFIVSQDGHVDLPHDRHSVSGPPDQRGPFLDKLQSVMPLPALYREISAKLVAREIKTREAADVVIAEDDGIRIVGNSNASAGYFYVTATPV